MLPLCSVHTLSCVGFAVIVCQYNNDRFFFPLKMVLSGMLFLFSDQLKNLSCQSRTLFSAFSIMLLGGAVSVLARWETGGVNWAVLWEQPLLRSLQGSHREPWSWGGPRDGAGSWVRWLPSANHKDWGGNQL